MEVSARGWECQLAAQRTGILLDKEQQQRTACARRRNGCKQSMALRDHIVEGVIRLLALITSSFVERARNGC